MTKMPRNIVKFPNPVLRKTAKAVKRITPEICKLVAEMESAMRQAPGVGLAAPQVGESLRIIIVDIGQGLHVLINPKLISKSGKQSFIEGCLSLPGIEAPVERPSKVKVKGMDLAGKTIEIEAEGLLAAAFQHEIDHLDGHVFIDRVKDPSQIKHVLFSQEKKEKLI